MRIDKTKVNRPMNKRRQCKIDANKNILKCKERNHTNLRNEPKNIKDTYAHIVKKQLRNKENPLTETVDGKRKILCETNNKNTKGTKYKSKTSI